MSKDVYIFEATKENFEQVVIQNSNKLPVVTLFMAVWSEPCFVLSEIFSKLAKEFAGQFIFAKVDIDEQQALREQFKIENVPSILVIQNGNPTMTSEGLLTEEEARVLLKGVHVFNIVDEMREQARKKHLAGDTENAIITLSEAIQQEPGNTNVALDMVQIFIDIKQFDQANDLFNKLPATAKDSDMGKSITGQLTFINLAANKPDIDTLIETIEADKNNQQARFDLAICLTAEYKYEQAVEQLLIMHELDESFQDGAAKELAITLIGMLKPTQPEVASRAQTKLSSLLIQ
ncbi:MAG TPA: tetratricopeptide repeat protein [Gammaproteobacteria bacterium]|nr:tetratricopeptide repeat protein [Gammaproteobacteria bacterium]